MQEPDLKIIKLLKSGNQKVFESIFQKYNGILFVYAKEYVVDTEVANEMVQETFLKLWEVKDTLSDNTTIQSYLYRITRNNCLNYLKHLKVHEKYKKLTIARRMEISLNYSALSADSADKIISEELEEKIDFAIKSLPPKCKLIFKMSRQEEKKYKEIAEELNLSVKTIENQILKALKILRKHLEDYITIIIMLLLNNF